MTYNASLDKKATFITIVLTILFAVLISSQYAFIKGEDGRLDPIYTTILCLLFYYSAFLFRPLKYIITEDEIIIKRPLVNVRFKMEDIRSVEQVDKNKIKWSLRIFGIGGLYGYYGTFANLSLGTMTWYATRKDKPVLIQTTKGKKVILTPDDPDQFVAELNQKGFVNGI